mgnify:CR=1 FL=1
MKSFIKTFSLILVLLSIGTAAKTQDNGAGHKIVFQLTDNNPSSQKSLTNQLKNLTKGWPEAQFEVVVHSAGISYLHKSKTQHASEIRALSDLGVEFKACENTLEAKNISKNEILDVAGFVPMGIGEVALKQEADWSYIKAGL